MEPEQEGPPPSTGVTGLAGSGGFGSDIAASEQPSPLQQPGQDGQQQQQQPAGALDAGLPKLPRVATKQAALAAQGPVQCVLLRAGGILSLLNMDEGTGGAQPLAGLDARTLQPELLPGPALAVMPLMTGAAGRHLPCRRCWKRCCKRRSRALPSSAPSSPVDS